MFIADETHDRLMKAEAGLESAKHALDEGKRAVDMLNLLFVAASISPKLLPNAVKILQEDRDKVQIIDMLRVLADGQTAVAEARSTLDFARNKIPNTIDAGTLEVCVAPITDSVSDPDARLRALTRGQTYNYRKDSTAPTQPRDVSRVVYVELKSDDPRVALVHSEPFLVWVHDLLPE